MLTQNVKIHESWWFDVSATLDKSTLCAENKPLDRYLTIGIACFARYYAEPASIEDLSVLIKAAISENVPISIIGRGSNIIVIDTVYNGLVIRLNHPFWKMCQRLDSDYIRVGSGLRLKQLCGFAMREELGGFEFLEGIPGTVGGAICMNAGAMGHWISERISRITFMDRAGTIHMLNREQLDFGYRHCGGLEDQVVLNAELISTGITPALEIQLLIETFHAKRRVSQPREPSAGCIFKNPEGDYAGRLIEASGLKGVSVGGARVSNCHANFIINDRDATGSDILSLVRMIRNEVFSKSGIMLQPEVLLLDARWEDVL
jgi:UDP-N-acetylenolpyruvoylglucosamine reductase